MNTLPFIALGLVASGYMVATERLNQHFDAMPGSYVIAYPASQSENLSVHEVMAADPLAHGAGAVDQPHCGSHSDLAQTLVQDFAENAVERRITAKGLQVELWASDLMGTWTLVHRGDDGISCIVGSGTGWQSERQADQVFASIPFAS